jgi:hypothetical protein
MKRLVFSLAALAAVTATPVAAQELGGDLGGPGYSRTEVIGNPSDIGVVATTGSRLNRLRHEANRGRASPFEVRMSPRQTRRYARDLIERADVACEVAEAEVVAYTFENLPVVEVDCREGGGLAIVDSLPIQATDCLDLPPPGVPEEDGPLWECRLPGNVEVVNRARQSARN